MSPIGITGRPGDVKPLFGSEEIDDHVDGDPGIGGKEPMQQNAVDLAGIRLRQGNVRVAAEIHQFPHAMDGHIAK